MVDLSRRCSNEAFGGALDEELGAELNLDLPGWSRSAANDERHGVLWQPSHWTWVPYVQSFVADDDGCAV
jgi:hypothetical protein